MKERMMFIMKEEYACCPYLNDIGYERMNDIHYERRVRLMSIPQTATQKQLICAVCDNAACTHPEPSFCVTKRACEYERMIFVMKGRKVNLLPSPRTCAARSRGDYTKGVQR
jgi:hypothetical protein